MKEVTKCINELKKVALVTKPFTCMDYIDDLIYFERLEKNLGWERRVESLIAYQNEMSILGDLSTGTLDSKFIKNKIDDSSFNPDFMDWDKMKERGRSLIRTVGDENEIHTEDKKIRKMKSMTCVIF